VRTRGQVGRRFGGERTEGRRDTGRITTNRPNLTGLLEPCAVKVARTVLRGPGHSDVPRLPDRLSRYPSDVRCLRIGVFRALRTGRPARLHPQGKGARPGPGGSRRPPSRRTRSSPCATARCIQGRSSNSRVVSMRFGRHPRLPARHPRRGARDPARSSIPTRDPTCRRTVPASGRGVSSGGTDD
jgi:hypothetical protein